MIILLTIKALFVWDDNEEITEGKEGFVFYVVPSGSYVLVCLPLSSSTRDPSRTSSDLEE